jgi:hypothetical protein
MVRKCAFAALIVLVALCVASPASAAGEPSYRIRSAEGASFLPASGMGNLFPNGVADDVYATVKLRGAGVHRLPFKIRAYGQRYGTIHVSSNGTIQFGGTPSAFRDNTALPTTWFERMLAVYWDDLWFGPARSGTCVCTRVYGTAPHRRYVIAWRGVHFMDLSPVRVEVIFPEGSGRIRTVYDQGSGAAATIGIQGSSAGPATAWSYNAPSVSNGMTLTFVPITSGA